jgi:hypothetical protein
MWKNLLWEAWSIKSEKEQTELSGHTEGYSLAMAGR